MGYDPQVKGYRKSSHTTYQLNYHFVFITKYRKPALRGDVAVRLRDLIREIATALVQLYLDRIEAYDKNGPGLLHQRHHHH